MSKSSSAPSCLRLLYTSQSPSCLHTWIHSLITYLFTVFIIRDDMFYRTPIPEHFFLLFKANILTLSSCYCNSAKSELNLINTNWGIERHIRERNFPRGLSSSCLLYLYWTLCLLCLKQLFYLLFFLIPTHTSRNWQRPRFKIQHFSVHMHISGWLWTQPTIRGPENIL